MDATAAPALFSPTSVSHTSLALAVAESDDTRESERRVQLAYWQHHVGIAATVDTMMLDSQAAAIDQLERPEILSACVLNTTIYA
jgi:hypothetical protein